ncbi:hypothetical protein F1880_001125 [Penicillium rolfsii]|nr:hypothetical protein F1880_001125 [Penicillium rolfsii]
MPSSAPPDDISVGDVFTPQADITQPSAVDIPANHRAPAVHMGIDQMSPRKQMANYKANGENMMQPPPFHPNLLSGKQRRKAKKKKQAAQADPAVSTVRGFTPLASADEDSDFSTTSSRAAESRPATSKGGASPRAQSSTGHGLRSAAGA